MVLNLNKVRPIEILLLWIAKFIKLTGLNLVLQISTCLQKTLNFTAACNDGVAQPRSFTSCTAKIYDLKFAALNLTTPNSRLKFHD